MLSITQLGTVPKYQAVETHTSGEYVLIKTTFIAM